MADGGNPKVSLCNADGLRIVTIENPPVNALGHEVRLALSHALTSAAGDPKVRAIVITGSGRNFVGGADIREFGKPRAAPRLPDLIEQIEARTVPVVAAINGAALGGGLELALACHYRIAVPPARLGLPEVKLGLLPGAGGTQRLPRLIGFEKAVELITSGATVSAVEAKDLGLIDAVADADLIEACKSLLASQQGRPLPLARDLTPQPPEADLFAEARRSLQRKYRGQRSPIACLEAIEAAATLPFSEGLALERRLFGELEASAQCAALRHVFFAERKAARVPDIPKDTPVHRIERVGVLGAGTMGVGITMCFANVGLPVRMVDVTDEAVKRGLSAIESTYAGAIEKGRLTRQEMTDRLALIEAAAGEPADLRGCDLVIEAVYEDLELKRRIFAALDRALPPGAILATNTSTLDVDAMAAATTTPERVVGLHFFSPANVMKLVEVVRAQHTAKEIVATAVSIARTIGKIPVVVGVCDGFVGNRMLGQRTVEADRLLLDGALPQQVDRVLTDFGFPMGPFAMTDLAGVDVNWRVRQARGQPLLTYDKIHDLGRLGQKSGKGFYRYEPGSRRPLPDPAVESLLVELSRKAGFERRQISDDEILERLVYPMINEGARILKERIAVRSSDIDVIWVYGYGWPAWRGGPMHYADSIGLHHIRARLDHYYERFGHPSLQPAELLAELAGQERGFSQWSDEIEEKEGSQ